MIRKSIALMFAVILILSVWLVPPSMAQYVTTFVRLKSGVPGVLYEPDSPGAKSAIGILVMHPRGDYLAHHSGSELADRGYRVLCANTSTSKSGFIHDMNIDQMLEEVQLGVAYLRDHPGIDTVVLAGHSGGGPLMTTFQNIAENGPSVCQGPEQIVKCPDFDFDPADGVMLLDAILGVDVITLLSLDPAVVSEQNAQVLNPALDMYNPENGFDPDGSTFTEKFKRLFFEKEKERMNSLISQALDRLDKIESGKGRFIDDEPLIILGGNFRAPNNRLFTQDLGLFAQTRNAWPLLTKDGITGPQIIYSVRVPRNTESPTPTLALGTLTTTVRKFLNTFAVRVNDEYGYDEDSITGIDYASSYNNAPFSVAGVTVPLLLLGFTGGYEYFFAETIYEYAISGDKTLVYVEGAGHGFRTCTACETAQGADYGDTREQIYDYIDDWLSSPGRFLP